MEKIKTWLRRLLDALKEPKQANTPAEPLPTKPTPVKPTPTIFRQQKSVDFRTMSDSVIQATGRHDPAIVHRARIVQDAATAIVLCDALALRFGTDYLKADE